MEKVLAGFEWIDGQSKALADISDAIWRFAEIGLHEDKSAEALEELLRKNGFTIKTGVGGMPTAFVATWGKGKPSIGFLGEYDALPGVSQKVQPTKEELESGACGHGCGHNLLGVAAAAGAIALREEMVKRGLSGTVKYFGCPAEENFSGKAFMAKDGLFNDLDVCLTWHPGPMNSVRGGSSLAVNSMNVTFHGVSSLAGGAPHLGRSALDAVELMNIGANYLREHVIEKARIHYVTTNGGLQPNVVASIMTDTTYDVELLEGIYEVLPNRVLEDVLVEAMEIAGPPVFTAEDVKFAKELSKTFPPGQSEAYKRDETLPDEIKAKLEGKVLNDAVLGRPPIAPDMRGSTDVGDVSWCCPTSQFSTACTAIGTPGHSWQYTAQTGMHIGHAGMIAAAKTLAQAGFRLMTDEDARKQARVEFEKRTGGKKYKSPLPPDVKPAFHQFDKK
ncbi:MAG: amidohydrolase [Bacillota bacterium]